MLLCPQSFSQAPNMDSYKMAQAPETTACLQPTETHSGYLILSDPVPSNEIQTKVTKHTNPSPQVQTPRRETWTSLFFLPFPQNGG